MGTKCIGIDIGSTTIKLVVLGSDQQVLHRRYSRHKSCIAAELIELITEVVTLFPDEHFSVSFTGSAGMVLSDYLQQPFIQEVIAATDALQQNEQSFDCCIELGGEDAKIIFISKGHLDQRMNGTCAGGTGAFIDQMATLLDTDSNGLNELAKDSQKIYPLASRCGVFAKSDIQALLNQGAHRSDLAASIYQAIVNQTIAGLSQGRKIEGCILFLGGPLTFSSELRKRFIETLGLTNWELPEHGETLVALGAALNACDSPIDLHTLRTRISQFHEEELREKTASLTPLFANQHEYVVFCQRHNDSSVPVINPKEYQGDAFLGIDAGSTTTKMVLLSEENDILFSFYTHNKGTPVEMVRQGLLQLYDKIGENITIRGAVSTGYGERLIKQAFSLNAGKVETVCHYKAAAFFKPEVDFIIDIGGQDMKCLTIENGRVTSIVLNEACSSGCGSFIETFSTSLGYSIQEFSQMALYAEQPVNLGSRCTVFMNSGVKQAQVETASADDISAGLSYSVVKNALYKVLRIRNAQKELGETIVVQGGTFRNDAVLRAFELEIGHEVHRPPIPKIMGAFGAALLAKEYEGKGSSILTAQEIASLEHKTSTRNCSKCGNSCALTINSINAQTLISGNRCSLGSGKAAKQHTIPNLYLSKQKRLEAYCSNPVGTTKGRIGIPRVMNMYEDIPFWATFFNHLGYEVVLSGHSTKALYETGQDSIPSDTVCYPAKMVHGHIEDLLTEEVDYIFYPNLPRTIIEKEHRDNEYNCPVVAFYPEVIAANMDERISDRLLQPYLTLNNKKMFIRSIKAAFHKKLSLRKRDVASAYDAACSAYENFRKDTTEEGLEALRYADEHNLPIILLAGRPYHVDPEVNHGIPELIQSLGAVVLSEDSINTLSNQEKVNVLNQWTYHTRLYDSAKFVGTHPRAEMIQLVSFGCGLDAVAGDEVKEILEHHGKSYTQIKIDEMSNLGMATIRIRSLLATMNERAN